MPDTSLPKRFPAKLRESWWGALEVGGSCLERVASVRAYTDCIWTYLHCYAFFSFLSFFLPSISCLTWMIQSHPQWGKKGLQPLGFYIRKTRPSFANDLPDSTGKFCPGVVWELSAKAMRDLWLLFPYEHLDSKSSEVAELFQIDHMTIGLVR